MKYNGAQLIIALLEQEGITQIAGIPGGANLPLYDALYTSSIEHILARHEQGAGFIAQGMARATGKPAVCFATSGPGATNLITALADAKADSVPVIAITGQVPTNLIGTDAFQEIDMYGMTIPITKHNFLPRSAEELLTVIPEAFKIARSGRPGPVLIDVPKDVQKEIIELESLPEKTEPSRELSPEPEQIKKAAEMIQKAKKPVLYIGGGITHSGAQELLAALARKNSIPVTTTLMGLGNFPAGDELFIGMLGMHGFPYTNYILKETDLLITLGARFDDRATGKLNTFCKEAKIIHIDIDGSEIDKLKQSHLSITADVACALEALLPLVEENGREEWQEEINRMRTGFPAAGFPSTPTHPVSIIEKIQESFPEDTIITTDVGQHQMWSAQAFKSQTKRTFLTSGGLGTMGFGLPAAIGASLALPEREVICITGDGSFLMNIQELATLAELNLNVTVIIFNNGHLGLVRQQQEMFYNSNYIASRFTFTPDFSGIAREFGITGYKANTNSDFFEHIEQARGRRGPCLIDFRIHEYENVLPIVPPGKANYEMILEDCRTSPAEAETLAVKRNVMDKKTY